MNIVYVLISDETDYYYEQLYLSIASLKKRSDADVTVIVDKDTRQTLQGDRSSLLKYVDSLKIADVPESLPKKARSRFIKTSLIRYITGDFLFIDCDTLICDDLCGYDRADGCIAAVLDGHADMRTSFSSNYINTRQKMLGYSATDKYYNSGVIFVRHNEESKRFFHTWHDLWKRSYKKGIVLDQPSFNEANRLMDNVITELSGIWNCQIGLSARYLTSARIIHYGGVVMENGAGISNYVPAQERFLKSIKGKGDLTDEAKGIIENPKGLDAFTDGMVISFDSDDYEVIRGGLYGSVKTLYRKHRKLYDALSQVALSIRNAYLKHVKRIDR